MALADLIVSLWQDEAKTRFLCSGIQLAPSYVLTAAHAVKDLPLGGQTFVFLLSGKDRPQPATLFIRHERLDAALLKLVEPIQTSGLSLPATLGDDQGRTATLHVIDPKTFDRARPTNYSVSGYDAQNQEYLLSPQTARGYSGGLLAVGEQPIGLLNRRMQNEPIARAIALADLRPWIAHVIGTFRGPEDRETTDYDVLLNLLGLRAMQLLANEGTADLRARSGFPQRADILVGQLPRERFQPLVVDLYEATDRCLAKWRAENRSIPRHFKADCLALLGELLKRAVDREGRAPVELADIAASPIDRMFVACRRTGTAAAVYCALKDIPLRIAGRKPGDRDVGGGSVIDLDGLAQGVGRDLEHDAYQAVWLAVKGASITADFGTDDFVDILQDAISMEVEDFHGDPLFIVTHGPREWLYGGGLASASERLRIGLVIHSAESDYAYLACEERRLINLVCKYLQLLDTA